MKTRYVLLLVLVTFVAGIATAALFQLLWPMLRSPGDYRATAFVHCDHSPEVLFEDVHPDEPLPQRTRRHAALIRTNLVLNEALKHPDVADLPWIEDLDAKGETSTSKLARRIEVGHSSDYDILSIGMVGDDPEQLVALVQAVTDAFLEHVTAEERKSFVKRRDVLEMVYQSKCEQLKRKREELRSLTEQAGGAIDLQRREQEAELLVEITRDIGRKLARLELEVSSGGPTVRLLQSAQITTRDRQPFDD